MYRRTMSNESTKMLIIYIYIYIYILSSVTVAIFLLISIDSTNGLSVYLKTTMFTLLSDFIMYVTRDLNLF